MSDASGASSGGVRQWLRKIRIVAAASDTDQDGIDLSQLHVQFTVHAQITTSPATLEARIFNVSDPTAQRLLDMKTVPIGTTVESGSPHVPDASRIILEAGYEGNYGIIFKGDIIQVRVGRESPADTYVDIFAGDGDWGHVWGHINTTLAAGWKPDDVNDRIRQSLSAYGLTVGDLPEEVPQRAAPRGKVMMGRSRDVQRELGIGLQSDTYVRSSNVEWLPASAYRPGDVIEVNAQTGMVNLPQQTNYGITVQMLLNPSVGVGSQLKINQSSIQRQQFTATYGQGGANALLAGSLSNKYDGIYKVLAVDHIGDTRGNPWYTTAICMALRQEGEAAGGRQAVQPPNYYGYHLY